MFSLTGHALKNSIFVYLTFVINKNIIYTYQFFEFDSSLQFDREIACGNRCCSYFDSNDYTISKVTRSVITYYKILKVKNGNHFYRIKWRLLVFYILANFIKVRKKITNEFLLKLRM